MTINFYKQLGLLAFIVLTVVQFLHKHYDIGLILMVDVIAGYQVYKLSLKKKRK